MADALQITVRFIHILAAVFWLGSLLSAHLIMAALRRVPPTIGPPALMAIMKRAAPAGMIAGVVTIVFGVWNQYLIAGGINFSGTAPPGAAWNVALGAALGCAVAIYVVGFSLNLPAAKKLEALAAARPANAPPGPPPPEAVAAMGRARLGLMLSTLLGLAALGLMVYATLVRVG